MSENLGEVKEGLDMAYNIIGIEKQSNDRELWLWSCLSLVAMGGIFLDLLVGRYPISVLSERYSDFMIALMVVLFPVVFKLIFNSYPLEMIRRRRKLSGSENLSEGSAKDLKVRDVNDSLSSEVVENSSLSTFSASELFSYYASSSRELSKNLYSRSGVYLLVGVFVAFSGLVFFYMETLNSSNYKGVELVVAFAPKFGILFFIELVAFFFLRQYRSAMDEFRYYEAVKRKREETLALILLTFESGKGAEVLELVKNGCFFSEGKLLSKDQTTEIIESRKLEKNEMEILEKVIEAVSRSKG